MENIDKIFDQMPPELFGRFFFPVFSKLFKRGFVKSKREVLLKTGLGRHSREETLDIGCEDLKAVSQYLGAKQYLMGDEPTKVDASLFGVLCQIVFAPYSSVHLDVITDDCPNIIDYVQRIKQKYWPDRDNQPKTPQ